MSLVSPRASLCREESSKERRALTIPSIMRGRKTSAASYTARAFSRHAALSTQQVGSCSRVARRSAFSLLCISMSTYFSAAIRRASSLGISNPLRAATHRPAISWYISAEQSGLRISKVCFPVVSASVFFSRGFALEHMSVPALHPRGTRTRAERLQSPQHTFVGAS